jgi:CxxC motif-containing protein (DUF1111 family)
MSGRRRGPAVVAAYAIVPIVASLGPGLGHARGVAPGRPPADPRALSAGAATIFDAGPMAFSQHLPYALPANRDAFFVGNSFFNKAWVEAPAQVTSRDGLGPLFNARSCSGCHLHDGRGRPPVEGEAMRTMLLRISAPGPRGPRPDPVYGDQLQGMALPGLHAEADVLVEWTTEPGRYPDGEPFTLRRPRYRLDRLGYGPPARGLLMSGRVAPALPGSGLLEAIPVHALAGLEDPSDRDRDGISGRLSRSGGRFGRIGRFGWKAEQPDLRAQVASAFLGDMGITSSLQPSGPCTTGQRACAARPHGGAPEVSDELLLAVTTYVRLLAVPARRGVGVPAVERGAALFGRVGCDRCHTPRWRTEPLPGLPELGGHEIHPFTDLLLHDLGPGLDDGRPVGGATGPEWRTPPLWGLGLLGVVSGHTFLLHDGRARGFAEAILWHGGEADSARRAFVALTKSERSDLIAFLEVL